MDKKTFQKLKNTCGGFLRCFAEQPFLAFIVLFLMVLAIGGLIFYQYGVLASQTEPQITDKEIRFQKDLYQQILNEWQTRDERFGAADSQKYINPFQENREKLILSVPEEPEVISADLKSLGAKNLLEFYTLKREKMPSLNDRAKMWQEFGLGSLQSYIGSNSQNQLLLAELKKRLTPL